MGFQGKIGMTNHSLVSLMQIENTSRENLSSFLNVNAISIITGNFSHWFIWYKSSQGSRIAFFALVLFSEKVSVLYVLNGKKPHDGVYVFLWWRIPTFIHNLNSDINQIDIFVVSKFLNYGMCDEGKNQKHLKMFDYKNA